MSIAHAVEVFSKYGGAFRVRHLAQHHNFFRKTARDGGKGTFRCSAYRDQRKLGPIVYPMLSHALQASLFSGGLDNPKANPAAIACRCLLKRGGLRVFLRGATLA